MHYRRWQTHGDPTTVGVSGPARQISPCAVEGCDRLARTRGWCDLHYRRWLEHGEPTIVKPRGTPARPLPERLTERIAFGSDCWRWTGTLAPTGYGCLSVQPGHRLVLAHRAVYELLVGPIPDGLVLHHTCGNRVCVRPDHLQPVTRSEHGAIHQAS